MADVCLKSGFQNDRCCVDWLHQSFLCLHSSYQNNKSNATNSRPKRLILMLVSYNEPETLLPSHLYQVPDTHTRLHQNSLSFHFLYEPTRQSHPAVGWCACGLAALQQKYAAVLFYSINTGWCSREAAAALSRISPDIQATRSWLSGDGKNNNTPGVEEHSHFLHEQPKGWLLIFIW